MPALFGDETLAEVGPRALRLRDTLGEASESLAWCVLRYSTNLLCMRPLRDGLLIVLTDRDANLPALRMAMSHSVRRLNTLLDGPLPWMTPGSAPAVLFDELGPLARTQEVPLPARPRR
jgi:hypothetical protein